MGKRRLKRQCLLLVKDIICGNSDLIVPGLLPPLCTFPSSRAPQMDYVKQAEESQS